MAFFSNYCLKLNQSDWRHMGQWQPIRSKLGFYFSSGITLDIDVFFFGALSIDQSKIKHTKKLKEIPFRDDLENPLEKKYVAFMPLYIWNLLAIYRDSANI